MSKTIIGLIAAALLPVLVSLGFSESCGNEILAIAPMLPGIAFAWYARYQAGGINILGQRA